MKYIFTRSKNSHISTVGKKSLRKRHVHMPVAYFFKVSSLPPSNRHVPLQKYIRGCSHRPQVTWRYGKGGWQVMQKSLWHLKQLCVLVSRTLFLQSLHVTWVMLSARSIICLKTIFHLLEMCRCVWV